MIRITFTSLFKIFLISAVLGSSFGYSHIYLFHICLLVVVTSWIILSLNGNNGIFIKSETALPEFFLIMISWYTLSLLWADNVFYALRYLAYIILGASIAYLLVWRITSDETYKSIYDLLKWMFLLEIVIALLEIFTSFRIPTSPYSQFAVLFGRRATDFGLFDEMQVDYLKAVPTGFRGNPNNLALIMATILPYFLFYRGLFIKILGAGVILFVIIMSGSRGCFIGAIAGIGFYTAISNIKRFLFLLIIGMLSISLLISAVDRLKESHFKKVAEIAYSLENLTAYLNDEDIGSNSIGIRKQLIRNGIDALYSTNGLGVGGGGSQLVQEIAGNTQGITSMHNFWAEVLVEAGVGFFLLFVIWYLSIATKLIFIYRRTVSWFYKYHSGALLTSFFIFSVACISVSSAIYHLPMWIMYGMGLALINIWSKSHGNIEDSSCGVC